MTQPTDPDGGQPTAGAQGPEPDGPGAHDDEAHIVSIAVTVTRTGGFAGLRRTWRAQPDTAEAPQWMALIDGCPWEAADPDRDIAPTGADRYLWRVDARCGDAERAAALADPEVQGPWRELIDAVRDAGSAADERPRRTPR
jgi:hypothetical protein